MVHHSAYTIEHQGGLPFTDCIFENASITFRTMSGGADGAAAPAGMELSYGHLQLQAHIP